MKLKALISFTSVAISLSSCPAHSSDGLDEVSIVDDRDVEVELSRDPERIAAVSYVAVDIALALGIKPVATTYMVEGRHPDFLLGLTSTMAQLGQRATPSLELLSNANPDVIVAIRRYTEGHAEEFENIAPYAAFSMESYTDSIKEVAELSKVYGDAERGEELNDTFEHDLNEYAGKVPENEYPRFVIMWAGETPFVFHTENTAAFIVSRLGGENIAGPMQPNGRFGYQMNLEELLVKDPEVIFVYDYGPDRPNESNPIWGELSAVKEGRVYYVGDHWVESNGPIAREVVLREAAHLLYPDTFPEVDVEAVAETIIPRDLYE